MDPIFYLLAAVVAGWMVQSYLTYRQSMAFNADVRALRSAGATSVGVGGRRYRGGRAFVAIAVEDGVVRRAITLRGFTTFARSAPLPVLAGVRVNRLCGDREVAGLSRSQREAAGQAAELYKAAMARRAKEEAAATT